MAKKEVVNYLESLEKKCSVANDFRTGTAMFAGLSAGMVAIAGVMGVTADLSTTIGMNNLAGEVREMGSYIEARNKLINDLSSGKIDYATYTASMNALESNEGILNHAKTHGNKDQQNFAESIVSTEEMADTLLGKGVPRMSAVMLAPGAVAYTVSEAIKRKYDRLLREAKAKDVEGM